MGAGDSDMDIPDSGRHHKKRKKSSKESRMMMMAADDADIMSPPK